MLAAALAYAEQGLTISPRREGSKEPAAKFGVSAATTGVDQIKAWWTENPDYNLGAQLGRGHAGSYRLRCAALT
jgi:hypothetical protein